MPSQIISVGGEQAVAVSSAWWARAPIPAVFDGWLRLRIALFVDATDSGASTNPSFRLGFCSGNSEIPGDPNTKHFAGMYSVTTISRSSSPARYILKSSAIKTVNNTNTIGTSLNTATYGAVLDATGTAPLCFFLDMYRPNTASTSYSFTHFWKQSSTSSSPVVTEAQFDIAAQLVTPTVTQHGTGSVSTLTVDEATDGVFDHVCMWWSTPTPTFNIRKMRVIKLV